MAGDFKHIGEIDKVLHSPPRLMIVAVLAAFEEVDFLYLLNETGLTKGNLSTHLSRLEEEGYIDVTKTYQDKRPLSLYRLNSSGRQALKVYRKQLRGILKDTE